MNIQLVIGSSNSGKLSEITTIIENLTEINSAISRIKPLTPGSLATKEIVEPEENGQTYYQNALIKARSYHNQLNMPVLTDDTGLEIDYLNNQPGVKSARYGGDCPFSEKIALILDQLTSAPSDKRRAAFHCSCILYFAEDLFFHGRGILPGTISLQKTGQSGFGYDSIFIPEGYNQTLAEIEPQIKNRISHRCKALTDIFQHFDFKLIDHEN